MLAKAEELDDVGAGVGAPDLTLVLEDGEPGDGEVEKGFDFRGPEGPP